MLSLLPRRTTEINFTITDEQCGSLLLLLCYLQICNQRVWRQTGEKIQTGNGGTAIGLRARQTNYINRLLICYDCGVYSNFSCDPTQAKSCLAFQILIVIIKVQKLPFISWLTEHFLYINTNNSLVTASKSGFIIVNCNRISLHFCMMIIGSVVRRRPKPSFLWLLCYLQIFYRLKNKQINKTLVWGD